MLWPLLSSSVSCSNGQWLGRTQAREIKAREGHLEKQTSHVRDSGINWISRQVQLGKGRPSGLGRLCSYHGAIVHNPGLIIFQSSWTLAYNMVLPFHRFSQASCGMSFRP